MGICAVCKEPVAGPVVPVITCEDREPMFMHPECFTCTKCAKFIPSDDSLYNIGDDGPLCGICNGSSQPSGTSASSQHSEDAKTLEPQPGPQRESPSLRRMPTKDPMPMVVCAAIGLLLSFAAHLQ
jgi:hypothetical protein